MELFIYALFITFVSNISCLSTNYEYYTSDGINSGLSVDQPHFLLNGKNISIYSGSIHYFRVPRAYWRDRIKKLKAMGANTVATYIAWNLHEPEPGYYDFGNGGSEMEDFLHLEEFLKIAQEEDLFIILRSGPYICAEFESGGFPSWILRNEDLIPRSSNEKFMNYVSRWFSVLMPILAKYQFTKGGPIIAVQQENEFAGFSGGKDKEYLTKLRQLALDNGIVELLITSDNPWKGTMGTITDYFFMTGDFVTDGETNLDLLRDMQPGKPVMVMEFYPGWFDVWGKSHQTRTLDDFIEIYQMILTYPASVNIYMFIGGTNYGFLSGAEHQNNANGTSRFSPITTSYDYDALLAENGDYSKKYYVVKELLKHYGDPNITIPSLPELIPRIAYPSLTITQEIGFNAFLSSLSNEERTSPVTMEMLNLNNGGGQSYGYIVYSKRNLTLPANSVLKIIGRVYDTIVVLVNGKRVSPVLENRESLSNFGTWAIENSTLTLNNDDLSNASLDLIVENWGRANTGVYQEYKGLRQEIEINDQPVYNWKHSSLELKKSWLSQLNNNWTNITSVKDDLSEPKLLKATLKIAETPKDTYVHMENWTKGVLIVNNYVLGRYSRIGPQQTLYLPAPFLKQGDNDIVIFEHFRGDGQVNFVTYSIYKMN